MWIMTTDFSELTPRQTRRVVRFTEPMFLTRSSPRADWRDAKLRGKTLFVVRHFVTLMAVTAGACSAVFETHKGGTCSGNMWRGNVAGTCGGNMWREHVAGTCGGNMWREHVAGTCGGNMWREHVAGTCGGNMWREHVAGTCGGNMWREHVAGTCCIDSFPRVTSPFLRKSSVAETEFCPRNMLHEIQLV